MICGNCQTALPDEAVACWKCGAPAGAAVSHAPAKKADPDILLVILAFLTTAAFFVCAGWTIPVTLWALVYSSVNRFPQWSGPIGILSQVVTIAATIALFAGLWWIGYKVMRRIATPA